MEKNNQRRSSNTGIKNKFTIKPKSERDEQDEEAMYSKKLYQEYELEQLKTIANIQHLDFGTSSTGMVNQRNLRMETADLKEVIFSTFDPTTQGIDSQDLFKDSEQRGNALLTNGQHQDQQKMSQISEVVDLK